MITSSALLTGLQSTSPKVIEVKNNWVFTQDTWSSNESHLRDLENTDELEIFNLQAS
jgi:hypothetical protein